MENGENIVIEAPGNSPENRYVNKMTVDGEVSEKTFLKYDDLRNGAKVRFDMQKEPDKERGTKTGDVPYSMSDRTHSS